MREDVLILLNEREPIKLQMANELEQQLCAQGHCVERLKPSSDVAQIICQRAPRVLILDYLLGDFGTALDVLQFLSEQGSKQTTDTILWTDEPSVHVAVSAMKLGARDYIEIGSPRAVQNVLKTTESSLRSSRKKASRANPLEERDYDTLIYQAASSRSCMAQACSAAKRNLPLVILQGDYGCGRNSLAKFIHRQRQYAGDFIELDLDTWTGEMNALFGSSSSCRKVPLLSLSATVLIDHAEFDGGELLETATSLETKTWGDPENSQHPMLIIGTCCSETSRAWRQLTNAELIEIPALRGRKEDFLPLLQRLSLEANKRCGTNKLEFTPEVVRMLSELEWPGNIRQLKAVVYEAITTPMQALSELLEQTGESSAEAAQVHFSQATRAEQLLYKAVCAARTRWEHFGLPKPYLPEALTARDAVEKACGNIRIAAAMLGCGVPQIRKALGIHAVAQSNQRGPVDE